MYFKDNYKLNPEQDLPQAKTIVHVRLYIIENLEWKQHTDFDDLPEVFIHNRGQVLAEIVKN